MHTPHGLIGVVSYRQTEDVPLTQAGADVIFHPLTQAGARLAEYMLEAIEVPGRSSRSHTRTRRGSLRRLKPG